MNTVHHLWIGLVGLGSLLATGLLAQEAPLPDRVEFDRDVRPILSDRCFVCHGPDSQQREADLRLDTREGMFARLADGLDVIRPGDLEHSAVIQRITSPDEDDRMPPAESKRVLSPREIEIIQRWIAQGAVWKQHWAFQPFEPVVIPEVRDARWSRNPIDRFVLARLESTAVRPSEPAGKERLMRRLCFDLTGLPPTLEELDAFLADTREDACEQLVDRLLASPHYGERMAVDWLDVSRYADTYGYQSDVYRAMWPWRDWVIRALNANMPYDQFVTWQLAGDLLPEAKQEQVLATAFNRHHRQTNEGGSVEEEFRVEYVADRVSTFGTAMLGLTLECTRCHDHKFDPLTQAEFYQLSAFFNSIDESGLYSHFTDAVPTPTLLLMDEPQRARYVSLRQQVRDVELRLASADVEQYGALETWFRDGAHTATISGLIGDYPLDGMNANTIVNRANSEKPGTVAESPQSVEGRVGRALQFNGENTISVPTGGDFTRNNSFSLDVWINSPDEKERAVILHRSRAWTDAGSRGYQLLIEDGRLSASLIHFWPGNAIGIRTREKVPLAQWVHVTMTYDGSSRANGLAIYVDGQAAECEIVRDNLFKDITGGGAATLDVGQRFRDRGFKNGLVDELKVFDRRLTPIEIAQLHDGQALTQLLEQPWENLTAAQRAQLLPYYLDNFDRARAESLVLLKQMRDEWSAASESIPEVMVMRELPEPRITYLLKRGAYDARGRVVEPGVPGCLPPWPTGQPKNRLGLARWLTHPQHPLLARVAVNRLWQSLFGRGLVVTTEDMGSQGDQPTHPELLDWLARHLVDSDWDVKALVRLIVTSATYRQDSDCSAEWRSQDPDNRLLARGPSYRLPAEMIRDNALYASGLLVDKLGGPPVKPYQPEGLWEEKSGLAYVRDTGDGSHRRSLYTFWKRTSPPPSMMTLDAPTREVCVARRQATATPLQALVFWNDPQYVEAARALAQRVLLQQPASQDEQLTMVFRLLTSRRPTADELAILNRLFEEQLAYFAADPEDAVKFLSVGDQLRAPELDATQLAALSAVAESLLSYDQTVMKR